MFLATPPEAAFLVVHQPWPEASYKLAFPINSPGSACILINTRLDHKTPRASSSLSARPSARSASAARTRFLTAQNVFFACNSVLIENFLRSLRSRRGFDKNLHAKKGQFFSSLAALAKSFDPADLFIYFASCKTLVDSHTGRMCKTKW